MDGYAAGPNQSLEEPLGIGGRQVHQWAFLTLGFNAMLGIPDQGTTGIDNGLFERGFENIGAWIMGRNMFGPVRGPWPDEKWKGWWGDDPPFHAPVFVLTRYPRDPLTMDGGTTFHFVTDGIQQALAMARQAAGGKDIRLGGGAATIRQYLQARLVDEMHLAYAPVLLGAGESLLETLDLPKSGYAITKSVSGENALHVFIDR